MRVTERFHVYAKPRPLCRRLRVRPETLDATMGALVLASAVLFTGLVFARLVGVIGGAR